MIIYSMSYIFYIMICRDSHSYYIQIILQIIFETCRILLIANHVWRCNMAFTVIIVPVKMHKQERRSLCRGRAFTQAGSSTVSTWYRYAVYTFSRRSSHRPFPSPRLPRLAAPGPTTYFLASRWHPYHIFSSRFASCTSRISRPYRAVACGRMHKSQCCTSATECSTVSCNNVSVLILLYTRCIYDVMLLCYYYIFYGFLVF